MKDPQRTGFRSMARKKALMFAAIPMFVLLTLAASAPPKPTVCTTCHSMQKYYDAWKKSVHGKMGIACENCHVKPGIASAVMYRLNFFVGIWSGVTGQKIKTLGVVKADTAMCRKCHTLNRERSTSGDLKINHRKHVEKAKIGCQKCHAGAIHAGVGKLGGMNPPMKLCKKCHQKQMQNCGFCHVIVGKKLPPHEHGERREGPGDVSKEERLVGAEQPGFATSG